MVNRRLESYNNEPPMVDDLFCETCDVIDIERLDADSYFYAA